MSPIKKSGKTYQPAQLRHDGRHQSVRRTEVGKELSLPVDKRQMGVIAQNVEQVFPEAVETIGTTGVKSVNYNMLMAPMIEAVKTLNRRIDALLAAVALLYVGLAVRFFMDMRRVREARAARIG
jgi:hypothetical protein